MSRRILLAWGLIAFAALPASAQVPFARDLVPTRTALGRLGLERHWLAVIPLNGSERLLGFSMAEDLVFVQTNYGNFHCLNAETGQILWTTKLGNQSSRLLPASVNSFAVFVTNLNRLYALERRTGRTIWSMELPSLPSAPTSCDEDRVMVSLNSGIISAYDIKVKDGTTSRISDRPRSAWNWQTDGVIATRPLPTAKVVAFGSNDGKVYVSLAEERTLLYRIATGGPIGAGLGAFGTRLLLVPSTDRNLYGVDLFTAQVLWTFPSGAPISQEPLVAGNDVYVVNNAGLLSSIDPNTGTPHWTRSTQGGRLLSVGAKRIYLESHDEDLFVIDRATGEMIADPRATYERIGLNLRPYDFGLTNRVNDRIYFATTSGMVIALRELGETTPKPLRDARALPFGHIPSEGISLTPPAPPAAESAPPATEGAEKPATEGADKPAGDVPPPAELK